MQDNSGEVTPMPDQHFDVIVRVQASNRENAVFKAWQHLTHHGDPRKVVSLPDHNSCEDHWGCVHWTDDDLTGMMKSYGIQPTPENIAKVKSEHAIRHIDDVMVERGWFNIEMAIQDAFPKTQRGEYHECQNCGKLWTEEQLNEVENLEQRVAPGDTVPTGECPECGAVCQPVEE